ncbi:FAD-dependent oxidoreductase [Pusillimonas sp. T2]|uniref:FAD-dependent oxidoreductase n=1 Tax=Pusillimonas sp. T2 TaxID=1548123 RepID=UPI000B946660|nr:GMC family oxidoreductase [Pusillimonas sp. T2]OXR50308.1 FAD-dependent oxidoreductase [Pusillimonas sp. T2]
MIEDANHVPANTTLQTDVCIIGAGAAGVSLALALQDSDLHVTLLESGSDQFAEACQALYQGSITNEQLHPPADSYRVRQFGGSTTLWGGRCMPLDPIDFEERDYIANSGWPINQADLLPYYTQANQLCEAGEFAYTAEKAFPASRPMRPMIGGFVSDTYSSDTLERFSCPTDFGKRYQRRLQRGPVRVLLNANAGCFSIGKDVRTAGPLPVKTLAGNYFTVNARVYVIATGGLETARLLLASPGMSGRGLGNAYGVVGRYYMSHIAGTIGIVDLSQASSVWHGYEIAEDGTYCRRRLALVPQAQRELRSGNFIARLHHPHIPDAGHGSGILSALYLARPIVPYEYAKRLYGEKPEAQASTIAHLSNVIKDSPQTVAFLWNWLRRRTLAERKFPSVIVRPKNLRFSLDFHAEQEPNPSSRVTLNSSFDPLGMPRINIDWRYSEQDLRTVNVALSALKNAFEESKVGSFSYQPEEVESEMTRYGAYGGHHLGTARMGNDPATSVVNADCRLHEVDNVYVVGGAVFPTSGQANPTLTIVALALRAATHLRKTLSAGKAGSAPATTHL